jgi:lysophospholipase L1-like esterase
MSAPYTAQFTGVTQGNHQVDAILRNAADLEISRDTNMKVGMLGDKYFTLGDSITDGVEDNYSADNTSTEGRVVAVQGYESVLTDLLDNSQSPAPQIVINEGVGGDDSGDTLNRIDSILARNPGANWVLILLGSNDSGGSMPRPSGAGCSGTACNGTFKGNMQALVNTLPSGMHAVVALVPPVFAASSSSTPYADPLSATRNTINQEYNSVIKNELQNIQVGPDLFSAFLTPTQNLFSLFTDHIHPNGLGYAYLAYLWHNALNPGSSVELPFILGNLTPSTAAPYLKQNLLEVGDWYYSDTHFTLASIPAELDGGVWIMTANADKSNTSASYLSFEVDRPVTVYIAYDAGATAIPDWLKPANGFSSTGTQLTVSGDASTSQLDLYSKNYPAGSVTDLGGNLAAGANGANSNYLVIVIPQ